MVTQATTIIITSAACVTALGTVCAAVYGICRWFSRVNSKDDEIQDIKDENSLLVYGLLACLDGLEQLGANHTVTRAKGKLEKYINEQAHK